MNTGSKKPCVDCRRSASKLYAMPLPRPRVPGPLSPSPDLLALLGVVGAFAKLDPGRATMFTPASHVVAIRDVSDWEEAHGIRFPDDVLVLAALGVPILERALGDISTAPHALDDGIDDDVWAAVFDADPHAVHRLAEDPTYQQVSDMTIYLAKDSGAGDPRVLVATGEEDEPPRATRLSKFLRARLDEHVASFDDADDVSKHDAERRQRAWRDAALAPLSGAELEAMFAATLEGAPAFAEIRVSHPKLGPGRIVGLSPDTGTAEVLFDSGERKKIKREFLKDA
jgi:hypothetical protein